MRTARVRRRQPMTWDDLVTKVGLAVIWGYLIYSVVYLWRS